jgi:hypothetical protein
MFGASLIILALNVMQTTPSIPEVRVEPVINTGSGLLENCTFGALESGQEDREYHLGQCIGFIKGVTNTLAEQQLGEICPPNELTNEELKNVVVAWLRAHPEFLEAPAVGAVVSATTKAFPCQTSPSADPGT